MPAKPAVFDAHGAPIGVEIRFVTFIADRPVMSTPPRLQLVHTNAASTEGTIASAWNWTHARPNANTLPHYQVDRNGAARKMLPTNRVGIANCTSPPKAQCRNWSLAYETADRGTSHPDGLGGFTPAQGETLAQILAYEAITHGIPLEYPAAWDGAGTACHTEPYYWSCVTGKNCPGADKKRDMREWVIPRARAIRTEWTAPPVPFTPIIGDDVTVCVNLDGEYWLTNWVQRIPLVYPGNDWALVAHMWELEDMGVRFQSKPGEPGQKDRPVPVPFPILGASAQTFEALPTT